MPCLPNEFSIDQVTDIMLKQNAFEVDRWTTPEILDKTREFISHLPFSSFKLQDTTDTLIFFVSEKIGFVTDFTNGCSSQLMWMDLPTTLTYLKFLGVH